MGAGSSLSVTPDLEGAPDLSTSPVADAGPVPDDDAFYYPRSIYQRYVQARAAWYRSLPPYSEKTNQLYRKAHRLPIRYRKVDLDWCLDYKQMGSLNDSEPWTKEETMAYLD